MPSATPAIDSASSPKIGNAYSGPRSSGSSVSSEVVRARGTRTSCTCMSWLPVPRSPDTFHVSITSTSSRGNSTRRMSGRPSASILRVPSSITMQPPISQSQWSMPLANAQRPVTT